MSPEASRPKPLRVLTWQVHGNYLYYLSQVPVEWWLVTRPAYPPGYGGRGAGLPWGRNVHEVPQGEVARQAFDLVLYQSRQHWDVDRHDVLSAAQRELPCIYLEHDPPQQHPCDTPHRAQDADLLVHVTPFNALMWDNGELPTRVIDHTAFVAPDAAWRGDDPAGIAVVNHLARRGRRLGHDLYLRAQREVPLALAGMDSHLVPGGVGEIVNAQLPDFIGGYRYLFQPARWTSMALAVVEAMAIGMPIVGMATTELPTVIENGVNGWVDTNIETLIDVMRMLSRDRDTAQRWGDAARSTMQLRFGPERFVRQWLEALDEAMARPKRATARAAA
ncbi:glycosyltransferase [Solimonas soli]|uniref:glycosyltransferase n=1 Tax=Solimonas soli TaxID=413479 RepID=UPI0004B3828D|nr:glycosyltransferase [Solimonas soli]